MILVPILLISALLRVAASKAVCGLSVDGILKYRDAAIAYNGRESHNRMLSAVLRVLGVNYAEDEELREFLCYLHDNDVRSIGDIPHLVGSSPAAVAEMYRSLVQQEQSSMGYAAKRTDQLQSKLQFLEKTGFPNFPVEIETEELWHIVNSTSLQTLEDMFYFIIEYEFDGTHVADIETLVKALTESQTLEDFAEAIIPGYMDLSYYDDFMSIFNADIEEVRASLSQFQTHVGMMRGYLDDLQRFGLLNLPRGGKKPSSCDSIANEAVSVVHLLDKVFPENVQAEADYLGVNFDISDRKALRDWFCPFVMVKSQKELGSLIPQERRNVIHYSYVVNAIMPVLADPAFATDILYKFLRGLDLAKQLGYPKLPLAGPIELAEELAGMMLQPRTPKEKVALYAKALLSAESARDLVMGTQATETVISIASMEDFARKVSAKTDVLPDLFFTLLRFFRRLEEYGFFMLPE